MDKFNTALNEIFGGTEIQEMCSNFDRGFYSPSRHPTERPKKRNFINKKDKGISNETQLKKEGKK